MAEGYLPRRVVQNRRESRTTSTLFFEPPLEPEPGQFVMAWLPGLGEKPFSLSYRDAITVRAVGPVTEALTALKAGDRLWLRGPYGKGFPQGDGYLLLGGGCGIAALRLLAERTPNPTVLLGAETKEELLFLEEFQSLGEVRVATEDGSLGHKGLVSELLPAEGKLLAVCGPEGMLVAARERLEQPPERIFYCLERYMKCGMGLCGHCTCSGWRVCIDGPVFDGMRVASMGDLGRRRRARSGKWERF